MSKPFKGEDKTEIYKVPLILAHQREGGYTVTSPLLPELLTEGDTLEEAVRSVQDALAAVLELYEDLNQPFPTDLRQDPQRAAEEPLPRGLGTEIAARFKG